MTASAVIRRRRFVALAAGAALLPLTAHAERSAVPVIGFMNAVPRATVEPLIAQFQRGLAESGYEAGRNVGIEYRFADGDYGRLPALATELVKRKVAVIVAGGGPPSAHAAKAATTTIPIVFTAVANPVLAGLVASFNRPGGNVTGISVLTEQLDSKRLELLCEMVPTARRIGILANPARRGAERQIRDVQATAAKLGRILIIFRASDERGIQQSFAALAAGGHDALLVLADPFFNSRRGRIVTLAAHHRIPAMYQWREFAEIGGLMSYGPSLGDAYRQAGVYTGRILKGANPATLPVLQPTKFDLVLNAKTARTLQLTIPDPMQARASEVIE